MLSLRYKAALLLFASTIHGQSPTYSATYLPSSVPYQTEQGQTGYNQCGSGYNQTSECQNTFINNVQDFCLWAPPETGPNSDIGNTKQNEVSWCMKSGYGTRLIPDGTISGAHFVITPDYVQVTGTANLTNLNIPAGDVGEELDPHGATGEGNPIGGLVFSSAFGELEQLHEWTSFMGSNIFCFRACKSADDAPTMCNHIYDEMGCEWNMPANYDSGVFEYCEGDSAQPMGVYGSSTFYQGEPSTPAAHPIPPSSSCTTYSTLSNGAGVLAGGSTSSVPTSSPISSDATSTVSQTNPSNPLTSLSLTSASSSGTPISSNQTFSLYPKSTCGVSTSSNQTFEMTSPCPSSTSSQFSPTSQGFSSTSPRASLPSSRASSPSSQSLPTSTWPSSLPSFTSAQSSLVSTWTISFVSTRGLNSTSSVRTNSLTETTCATTPFPLTSSRLTSTSYSISISATSSRMSSSSASASLSSPMSPFIITPLPRPSASILLPSLSSSTIDLQSICSRLIQSRASSATATSTTGTGGATGTSNAAMRVASLQGMEHTFIAIATLLMGSSLGAVMLL